MINYIDIHRRRNHQYTAETQNKNADQMSANKSRATLLRVCII